MDSRSILFLFVFVFNFIYKCSCTVVTIEQGTIYGHQLRSRNGTTYYGFYNIPYAKPPVGELRFLAPQDPEPWTGLRNYTISEQSRCYQKDIFSVYNNTDNAYQGSEDCLHLVVYTPQADKTANLNVMVWIHGGAFVAGSGGEYLPTYFMDRPVVLVNINYRLGLFGFLSTVDEVIPGNNGFKDQTAALRWVKKNIRAFGGNPDKVTIFGQSAGGASVNFHLYSSLSSGLFHRAISQSGSSLATWTTSPQPVARARAQALGILCGCPVESKYLLECLQKVPQMDLLKAQDKFFVWNQEPTVSFSAVEEPDSVPDAFLKTIPRRSQFVNKVPTIFGFCAHEGCFRSPDYVNNEKVTAELNTDYKRVIPIIFNYAHVRDEKWKIEISERIKKLYFENTTIISSSNCKSGVVKMYSDGYFMTNIVEEALRHRGTDTYFFMFAHKNMKTDEEIRNRSEEDTDVCHGQDTASLFQTGLFYELKGEDIMVSQRMINYWTNFADSGNPNGDSSDQIWQPIKSSRLEYLRIRTFKDQMRESLIETDNFNVRFELWKNISLYDLPRSSSDKLSISLSFFVPVFLLFLYVNTIQ